MASKSQYLFSVELSLLFCIIAQMINLSGQISLGQYLWFFTVCLVTVLSYFLLRRSACFNMFLWAMVLVSIYVFWFDSDARNKMLIDEYSIVVAVHLVINTIFVLFTPRSDPNLFFGIRTYSAQKSPETWSKVQFYFSLVAAFFELPLFLLFFYVPGTLKFVLSTVGLVGALILGIIFSELRVRKLIKEIEQRELLDLKEQLRKEEGYR